MERYWEDLHRSRLERGLLRALPVVLALVVGLVVALAGPDAGAVVGLLIGAGYGGAIAVADRRRWHAQDLVYGYHALREARWTRETGGPSPVGVRGRAETWLATHPAGTVPQLYRAIVAWHGGDPVEAARERAAMPEVTPVDRARAARMDAAQAIDGGGLADTHALRDALAALEDGLERREMEAFVAQAEAIGRHRAASADWLGPLADAPALGPAPVAWRRRLRLWFVRLRLVIAFAVLAVVFGAAAPAVVGPRIPDAWSSTELAIRGEPPDLDRRAIDAALVRLADAVAAAGPVDGAPLDPYDLSVAIEDGLPTLIWTVGAIDFTGPREAPGRLWEIEVLAGLRRDDLVLLTFDREGGPAFRYRVDHDTAEAVRAALGVGR